MFGRHIADPQHQADVRTSYHSDLLHKPNGIILRSSKYPARTSYQFSHLTIDSNAGGLFFVDGPAGTGKTFVETLLLAYVGSRGEVALTIASSGIASRNGFHITSLCGHYCFFWIPLHSSTSSIPFSRCI